MSQKLITKNGKRFVLYISNELRNEITDVVNKDGTTLADFAREAFELYLKNRKQEEKNQELAEACALFSVYNANHVQNGWRVAEHEGWPI